LPRGFLFLSLFLSLLTPQPFSAHLKANRGIAMDRFARGFAFGLTLVVVAVGTGCSGGGGLLTGSTPAAADAPGKLANEDPSARPMAVAWTSARAQRCGFYFDPAKLRASYLAYEARQSSPDQVGKAQQIYDSTFKTIRQKVAADPDYCSDAKSAEIKKDLTRHLAGDFTPNLPKPKVAQSCGFFGCSDGQEAKWTPETFWAEQERKNSTGR
jgi:hypothetical protein